MQIEDAVKKHFCVQTIDGHLVATVKDVYTDETVSFDALGHWVHICTASKNNVTGEAAAFLGGRGGDRYVPIIVCGRFCSAQASCYLYLITCTCFQRVRLRFQVFTRG